MLTVEQGRTNEITGQTLIEIAAFRQRTIFLVQLLASLMTNCKHLKMRQKSWKFGTYFDAFRAEAFR